MASRKEKEALELLKMMKNEKEPSIYPLAVVLIVFSAIAIILATPPLIWHASKRNIAVTILIVWILLLNLINFVNAIIWPNDDLTSRWEGYGLCDVEVKLQIASYVGLPGALACIMRTLAGILDTKNTSLVPSAAQKRRNLAFLIVYCFAFPVYLMAIHYVVQPNRYAVWAISGCTPTVDGSWLALVLVFVWPLFVSAVAVYYAIYLVVRMQHYRAEFSRLLQNSNTTKSRFLRLFIISIILVLVVFPLQIYVLYRNVEYGISAYSWSRTHSKYWHLIQPVPTHGQVVFDRWIRVGAGYLLFAMFGLGSDATKMYKSWLVKIGLARVFPNLDDTSPPSSKFSWGSWGGLPKKARGLLSKGTTNQSTGMESNTARGSTSTYLYSPNPKSYLSSGTQTNVSRTSEDSKRIQETKEIWLEKERI